MGIKGFVVKKLISIDGKKPSVISIFGVAGVFLGVFSIITVVSVMFGFQDQLIKRITGNQPHIYITNEKTSSSMDQWKEVLKSLENIDGVVSPYVENEVILYVNNLTLGAVSFSVSNEMFKLMSSLELEHRQVILGEQLGLMNQLVKMDNIEVVSGWEAVSSSISPKLRTFVIKDFIRTGTYARDLKYAYFDLKDAMDYFTPIKGVPSGVAVLCRDVSKIDDVSSKIKVRLKNMDNLKIQTWKDRNSKLFNSLKLERIAMIITLFFIILVASFSITVSLVMMVESKRPEFAVLSSMGLCTKELKKIVTYIALSKGVVGALFGGIVGTLLCYLIQEYRIITLPSIYYDTYLPIRMDLWFNIMVVILAVFICVLGVLFPLRMVSRISITNELRKN